MTLSEGGAWIVLQKGRALKSYGVRNFERLYKKKTLLQRDTGFEMLRGTGCSVLKTHRGEGGMD